MTVTVNTLSTLGEITISFGQDIEELKEMYTPPCALGAICCHSNIVRTALGTELGGQMDTAWGMMQGNKEIKF